MRIGKIILMTAILTVLYFLFAFSLIDRDLLTAAGWGLALCFAAVAVDEYRARRLTISAIVKYQANVVRELDRKLRKEIKP